MEQINIGAAMVVLSAPFLFMIFSDLYHRLSFQDKYKDVAFHFHVWISVHYINLFRKSITFM